jgi:hypothetical protein
LAALAAPAGWLVSDHLEQDNDFCNSCHLAPGQPLHRDVRRDFDAAPPASLAGVHGAARLESREDGAFRCIDCHGGHGLVGRARVKALAAKDAFWYVMGRFEEPQGMRWPLWDEDCRKCHASFDESEGESWRRPRFHQLAVHNVALGVDCVDCHRVHEAGGNPKAYFLETAHVRGQCALCHSEFAESAEHGRPPMLARPALPAGSAKNASPRALGSRRLEEGAG